jgi:hypothetical protein
LFFTLDINLNYLRYVIINQAEIFGGKVRKCKLFTKNTVLVLWNKKVDILILGALVNLPIFQVQEQNKLKSSQKNKLYIKFKMKIK